MTLQEFLTAKKETLADSGQILLSLKVKTHARESKLIDILLDNETVKVSLNAAPVEGKANKELMSLLSDEFGVAKSNIFLLRGKQSSFKTVKILRT